VSAVYDAATQTSMAHSVVGGAAEVKETVLTVGSAVGVSVWELVLVLGEVVVGVPYVLELPE
jgi:hypothetical protein